MKHILIPTLLVFGFFGFVSFTVSAQEVQVDSELMREIMRGHRLLSQYTEAFSGKMECFSGSSTTQKLEISLSKQFLFFRDNDLLRLEYINPMEGTEIFPGHEKNDITEVTMRSKDHYFIYTAIPSTGVPYANLLKSTVPGEALEMTLESDFYGNINALVQSGSIVRSVTELLQDNMGSVETRRYNNVPDALWIKSAVRKEGDYISHWTIVLNPKQYYALLFDEMRVENSKEGFLATSSRTVTSQVTDSGSILPKEIVFRGQTKALIHGQKQEVNTGTRTLMSILSTNKPDNRLFTEESFKDLGRDFAVVNVLPNQQYAEGGHIVNAAPLESRMPYYPIGPFSKQEWSWARIVLCSVGILLMAIGALIFYLQRRRFKNK